MEALSSSIYVGAPRTETSHIRTSSRSTADPASALNTTRMPVLQPTSPSVSSAQASQDSVVSVQSTASSHDASWRAGSADSSQLTASTDFTSPKMNAPTMAQAARPERPSLDTARAKTPDNASDSYSVTSPMSITSPVSTYGAKRTASGHFKNAPSLSTPTATSHIGGRQRADSLSSSGSRASELAASLKTRLGYAMAKVQHGWEHKSIAEVERLAAQRMSPHRLSASNLDRPSLSNDRGGSMYSAANNSYALPPRDCGASPPSKRHSLNLSAFAMPQQDTTREAPRLQPAVDLWPSTNQRRRHQSSFSQSSINMMSPPHTPINGQTRRPPNIRTETQTAEAEREALQALFQLGSPHASQMSHCTNASQESSSQTSPLRSQFAATSRHVTFARSESDRSADSQASGHAVSGLGSIPQSRERVMAEA